MQFLLKSFLIICSQKDKEAGFRKLHASLSDIGKSWSKMNNLLKDVDDPSLFQRAFTSGLQEFIEALCLLSVLEESYLPSCDQVRFV